MEAKNFPFDKYLAFLEEKQGFLQKFMDGTYTGPVLTQRYTGKCFGVESVTKERALSAWLESRGLR